MGGISAGLALVGAACAGPPPPAPSAVIEASPRAVCLGDGNATRITLDSSSSSPELTLVPVPRKPTDPPLGILWSFAGSAYEITEGDPTADVVTLTMAGDRPLHVTLRVENAEGGVTEAVTTIAVTPRDATGGCPLPVESAE